MDTKQMFKSVVDTVEEHLPKDAHMSINEQVGTLNLKTKSFGLNVEINEKWIGYEFELNSDLTDGMSVGSSVDTDNYALDFNTDVSREIFDDVLSFVKNLLKNKILYGSTNKRVVLAIPKEEGKYEVTFFQKRRFLTTINKEIWPEAKIFSDSSFKQLEVG